MDKPEARNHQSMTLIKEHNYYHYYTQKQTGPTPCYAPHHPELAFFNPSHVSTLNVPNSCTSFEQGQAASFQQGHSFPKPDFYAQMLPPFQQGLKAPHGKAPEIALVLSAELHGRDFL